MAGVGCHAAIGSRDCPQAEVVRPTPQQAVETAYDLLGFQPQPPSFGLLVKFPVQPLDLLVRRPDPDVGPTRLRPVAPPDGVPQEGERLVRTPAQPRLRLVHR